MKKILLASIFGVFLLAGTAFLLTANEPVQKAAEASKPCCEAAAKAGEKHAGCAGHAAGAVCCKTDEGKPTSAAAGCAGTAACGKSEAKTNQAAAGCGSAAGQATTTPEGAGCGEAKPKTSGCQGATTPATRTSEAVPGGCTKPPAGASTQRAENR